MSGLLLEMGLNIRRVDGSHLWEGRTEKASLNDIQSCPNLLNLNLTGCTSITMLPDSIGHLSRLQILFLYNCGLQTLPSSTGHLTALQILMLTAYKSLEVLPDTITQLSGLQRLWMDRCSSPSKLPTTMGLMPGLTEITIDLVAECQAVGIGQLNGLKQMVITECTDELLIVLDNSGELGNLNQLFEFYIKGCTSITRLPETIGLLTNLVRLRLVACGKLQELPNSIGQLKALQALHLRGCSRLETLPDSFGALTSLQGLHIMHCTSMTKLPTSIGLLSNLRWLRIQGCDELQPLPDSMRQLNALDCLEVIDCGSLEGLGALGILQGLRIWGCTSITELPGSCLIVLDSAYFNPASFSDVEGGEIVRRNLKELRRLEADDCAFLRDVQDTRNGRIILQRVVYKSPLSCKCSHIAARIHKCHT